MCFPIHQISRVRTSRGRDFRMPKVIVGQLDIQKSMWTLSGHLCQLGAPKPPDQEGRDSDLRDMARMLRLRIMESRLKKASIPQIIGEASSLHRRFKEWIHAKWISPHAPTPKDFREIRFGQQGELEMDQAELLLAVDTSRIACIYWL